MSEIIDKEFGTIQVRTISRARSLRATVAPNGSLRISVPPWTPKFAVKRMIESSREDIRKLFNTRPAFEIKDGMKIGTMHTLVVRKGSTQRMAQNGNTLVLTLVNMNDIQSDTVNNLVRNKIITILRKEAKLHLPSRIAYLAKIHGLSYTALRFSHASTRWGSCTNKRVISLNIALMNLPYELIDYVLVHELAHTVHLNHSQTFWGLVERIDPNYKIHRKQIKAYSPGV